MKCVICKYDQTEDKKVTITLERDRSIVVIKGVPAIVCKNCGDYYLSEEITKQVLEHGEDAIEKGVELEVTELSSAL